MSIVLGGKKVDVPGVETISYLDDPALVPRATEGYTRSTFIRAIVAHTVHGAVGVLKPGGKPSTQAEWYARYQSQTSRQVSWDFTVDVDGTVAWSNDPILRATWHGHTVNPVSIGFEMVQDQDGTMYQATITAARKMIHFLTAYDHPKMAVQRQTPWRNGKPYAGRIVRCQAGNDGLKINGVYGHRNIWIKNSKGEFESVRGPGDPNDYLFTQLHDLDGYEGFETEIVPPATEPQDVTVWKVRQRGLLSYGSLDIDGMPGAVTKTLLKRAGHVSGLWIADRPFVILQ